MYTQYFGLRDKPFSITPDPAFVYMSPAHQEALGHLLYGTGADGGFVQLTGEVGTGKTTLIRTLLKQDIANLNVALILNPRLTAVEFLQSVCEELHADFPRDASTLKPLVDALNAHLLKAHAEGRHTVIIVDEAQNLPRDLLEQIRLLTNLETHRDKLLRIMLIGQPELRDLLMREDLRQLSQRITARYHLQPLDRAQTATYVTHRVQVAGGHPDLFTASALRTLYSITRGVPRLINIVCDRALLGAYSQNLRKVDRKTLIQAADEALEGTLFRNVHGRYYWGMWAGALAASVLLGVGLYFMRGTPSPRAPAVTPAPAVVTEPAQPPAVVEAPAPEPVPPPAPEPAPEPLPARFDSMAAGLPVLAALWEVPLESADDDGVQANCGSLARSGLRCLNGKAGWTEIASYNLPALIQLPDGFVLARKLGADTVEIETPAGIENLAVAELKEMPAGEFLMLWRSPIKGSSISGFSSPDDVSWLDRQLRFAEGTATQEYPQPQRFDEQVAERVRAFQRGQGLRADGQVGPRTLIRLAQLAPGSKSLALRRN